MKILCLADLHINHNRWYDIKKWIKELISDYKPDVIIIVGDIVEDPNMNPYKILSELSDIPILCVFGNHEFCYSTIKNVHEDYERMYEPKKYNVHYLDLIGHYDINNIRFLGNVLWYDGSLKELQNQDIYDWVGGRWLDQTIKDFDYEKENQKCVKQIKDNIDENKTNILVTHCVPHKDLNGHFPSELNAFSGMADLLKDIDVQYSISGHTHKRILKEIRNCTCINVGNDYSKPYEHYLLEI